MLNRTYLVLITEEMLCGAKVRGLLAAPINVTERWKDPYFYPKLRFLEKLMGLNPRSPEFLNLDPANCQIEWDRIKHVEFSVEKEWGMGTVPHAGRIFLTILGEDTKELIIPGTQDGEAVKNRLAERAHDAV
jgi:hypothetical protein